MAKKRRAGMRGAAEGLSSGVSDVLALLLQSKLIGDRQGEQQQATLLGQALDDARTEVGKIDPAYVRTHGPQAAEAQYETAVSRVPGQVRSLLGQRPDFAALDTPYPERVGKLTEEIAGITNPDDLRLTPEGLRKRAPGMRVQPDLKIPNLLPGSGGTDSGMRVEDPAFAELVTSAGAQREGLLAKEAKTAIPSIDASGTQQTTYRSNRDLAGGPQSFQTERTTGQQASREAGITGATEQAKTDVAQDPANVARGIEIDKQQFEAMTPLEIARFQKTEQIRFNNEMQLATQKAALDLQTAGKVAEAKTLAETTTAATMAMNGIEEMAALATEVNSGFDEGTMDVYAGTKQMFDTLPFIGQSMSSLMTGIGSSVQALADKDPTVVRKIFRLQGMRREMAIASIRAAGDPRPSDSDVAGLMPTLPGPFESRQQTAEKIQFMRDRAMAIPELLAENPGLRGKALLDAAAARAQQRSGARATVRPDASQGVPAGTPSGGLSPIAQGALEILNAR